VRGFAGLPARISRNILTRYSAALALALVAISVQWTLHPVLGNRASYLALFPAIALSAWLCGLGPSLLTLILGLCIPAYLFAPFQRSSASPPSSLLEAVAFVLAAGAIIAVAECSRRKNETLRESQDDLEQPRSPAHHRTQRRQPELA
jgi:hypothetical protein